MKNVVGNQEVVKRLSYFIKENKLAHAYLFSGPLGVGKRTCAIAFAKALLCQNPLGQVSCNKCSVCQKIDQEEHPDFRIIKPLGNSIKIEQIRNLQKDLILGSKLGSYTLNIILDAQSMTKEASNSLLKTLEEPNPGTIFILVTSNPQFLLPTIVSRCQQMVFQYLKKEEVLLVLERLKIKLPSRLPLDLFGGSVGKIINFIEGDGLAKREQILELANNILKLNLNQILKLAEDMVNSSKKKNNFDKKDLLEQLDLLLLWYRDIILKKEGIEDKFLINKDQLAQMDKAMELYSNKELLNILAKTEKAKKALNIGANTRLTIETLFLALAKKIPN